MSVYVDNRTDRIVTSNKYSELASVFLFLETALRDVDSEIPNRLNAKDGSGPESRETRSPLDSVVSAAQDALWWAELLPGSVWFLGTQSGILGRSSGIRAHRHLALPPARHR
jgi:hypothetical protein